MFITGTSTFAQETEQQLVEQATKLFEQESFVQATSLYLRLLALNPRSPDYNYRYGTCLLFNSNKKQDAFKYLNYAVSDPNIATAAYFYLGKAFHLNYQFNEAIKNYEIYKQKAGAKVNPNFSIDRQIEMCQNGKRLLTTISDLVVIEKKEIEIADFFRSYNLKNIGGGIIVAADYQSKIDKKRKYVPVIHFPENSRKIYYASYGDTDEGQKDIYVRQKLPDGTWSLPQKVQGNVNTQYDEDFPFMHPSGEYLYYCSKGHNSMGGYDVFRSKLDAENNSFGPPENMDFAISSPDDDLFYIADSLNQNAYFASSRQSADGKLFVYKVRVDRVPLQLAIVKGEFSSKINPSQKKVSIEITDYASGEKIGTFASNDKGRYLITFPKGGKYKYTIKVEGSKNTHEYIVSIPFLKEFKPLKQRMTEELESEAEVVKIQDLFDENVEDPQAILAEVIKMRSELNVNAQNFDINKLDAEKENKKVLEQIGLADASNQEIQTKFETLASKQEKQLEVLVQLQNGSQTEALKKVEEIKELQQDVKIQVALANKEDDPKAKYKILKEAEREIQLINEKKAEIEALSKFSDSISKLIPAQKDKTTALAELSEKVKGSLQADDFKKLTDDVSALATLVKETEAIKSNDPVDALVEEKNALQKKEEELQRQKNNYETSAKTLETEISQLEKQLSEAKEKAKPALQSKIDGKTSELNLVKEELASLDKKINQTKTKEVAVLSKIEFLQEVKNVSADKTVAPEELAQKRTEIENKNSRSLEAYVKLQVEEFEKKGITTNESDPEVVSETVSAKMLELTNENQAEQKAVDEQSDLSEKDKLELKVTNDQQLLKKIAVQEEKIKAALAENPGNSSMIIKQEEIQKLKATIQQQIDNNKTKAGTIENQSSGISKEEVLASIFPTYEDEKKAVSASDPKERLSELTKIDEALLTKISAEQKAVAKTLKENPNDKAALSKQEALTELEAKTKDEIGNRNSALAALNNSNGTSETADPVTKEEVLAAIFPTYEDDKKAVSASDPKERLTELTKIDEALLTKVSAEQQAVAKTLKANPNDKAALSKQEALTELEAKTKDEIENRNSALAALNNSNGTSETVDPVTKEEVLAAIFPTYEDDKKAVSASDPKERLTELTKIDEALLTKISAEQQAVAKTLKANPNDKAALSKQEALTELEAKTKDEIENRNSALAALNNSNGTSETADPVTKEEVLAAIFPTYEDDKKAVSASDPKERLTELTKIDEALLTKITAEQQAVAKTLKANPNDKAALSKQEALTELEAKTKDEIENRNSALAALNNSNGTSETADPVTKEEVLAAIFPTYEDDKKAVSASDPKERLTELTKIDEALLTKISAEQQSVAKTLKANPNDKAALSKQEALTELEAKTKDEIENRNSALAALNNSNGTSETADPVTKEEVLAAIFPTYEDDKKSVSASDPKERLTELTKIDEALLTKITAEQQAVAKTLKANPNDKAALSKQEALTELEAKTKDEIENRNSALAALNNSNGTSENVAGTNAELKAEVRPKYEANLTKIEQSNLSESQKEIARIKEERALLIDIEEKQKAIDKKALSDPNNVQLKEQATQLTELQAIQEAKVEEQEQDLIAEERAKIDPNALLMSIDPAYSAPNTENKENWTAEDVARMNQNEAKLQEKLNERLVKNNKLIQKGFDPKIVAESNAITSLIEESKERQAQFTVQPVTTNTEAIAAINEALGEEANFVMNEKPKTKEEAERQLTLLKELENTLVQQEQKLQGTTETEQLSQVQDALKIVRKRKGVIEIDLSELEVGPTFTATNSPEENQLIELKQKENELQKELASADASQQKGIQKELQKNQAEQAKVETTVAKVELEKVKTEKEERLAEVKQADKQTELSEVVVARIASEDAKKEELTISEQRVKQEKQVALIETVQSYNQTAELSKGTETVVTTEEELKAQKRQFSIEIGQLEAEQQVLVRSPKTEKQYADLARQKEVLEAAVATIDKQLGIVSKEKESTLTETESSKTAVTYEEERELASQPIYTELREKNALIQAKLAEEKALITQLDENRLSYSLSKSESEKEKIVQDIVTLNQQLVSVREERETLQADLDKTIATTNTDPMKWKNLLNRDIASIALVSTVSTFVPELANGFEISKTPTENREKKILVGVNAPNGLVYRVQVGAFAKPIPENLFKEFTPVTGEKLNNGITRYLAGYFGDRNKVVQAQQQIRGLGYADAFVVAYCDGERITLAEARRLEDQGLCVPKKQDSLLMDVAARFVEQLPEDTLKKVLPRVKPSDYNKAPGAVVAEAVEEKLGLFFTVQIGVYNKPVNAAQIRDIKPLITKRLENGQIRYSSGVFQSVDAARPKKEEARLRGISDAFITAYYKGERISLAEAQQLLDQFGQSILEGGKTAPVNEGVVEQELKAAEEYAVLNPVEEIETPNKHIQLVSKKTYTSYPRDVVNRFNAYGAFYYDEQDGKVKSVEYANEDVLPRVYYLKNDIDTVYNAEVKSGSLLERTKVTVVARFGTENFTAEMANWLLRCNLPRTGKLIEGGIELSFTKVNEEDAEELRKKLLVLGGIEVFVKENE